MESSLHTLGDLFGQLGLASDTLAIDAFISSHRPLARATRLADALFWNPAQRDFLREQLAADADWAELVDQLDARLR